MGRKIINKESFSVGKNENKNDDEIYIGENFVAVIDGVSNKNSVVVDGEKVKLSRIITEAIRKMDRPQAPQYAKSLSFEEFVKYINLYISEYLQRYGLSGYIGKLEATGVIYSKFHNQIWLVGDCRAIYDGKIVQNPLKVDEVYIDIRRKIMEALIKDGYTEEQLLLTDISRILIKKPELLDEYVKNAELKKQIGEYRANRIRQALSECGFSEQEIEEKDLIRKFYDSSDLQQVVKNNPNMGTFGYSVFNGLNTEIKNCKVETLPANVRYIKMFSDGFPIEAMNNEKDIGYAVRLIRKRAKEDPLSIKNNPAAHVSMRYSKKDNRIEEYAIDDASAVIIEISRDEREDDERG